MSFTVLTTEHGCWSIRTKPQLGPVSNGIESWEEVIAYAWQVDNNHIAWDSSDWDGGPLPASEMTAILAAIETILDYEACLPTPHPIDYVHEDEEHTA